MTVKITGMEYGAADLRREEGRARTAAAADVRAGGGVWADRARRPGPRAGRRGALAPRRSPGCHQTAFRGDLSFDSGDPDFFFSRSPGFITDWFYGLTVGGIWEVEALTGSFTVEGIGMTLYNSSSVRGIAGSQFEILSASTPPTDRPTAEAPEPATLALFGLGLAGLGFMRRWRAS